MAMLAVSTVVGLSPLRSPAQAEDTFFAGRNLTLNIGYGTGGGYDVSGRVVARHIGKHLPGRPTVVVKNMPGAGSVRLANYLFNAAPRDGSEIGAVGREIPIASLLNPSVGQFQSEKLNWLGSVGKEGSVCVAWHTAPVKSADDLFKQKKEFIVGGTNGQSLTIGLPIMFNNLFGTRMKPIAGYPGTEAITLAMERGEVQGLCYVTLSTLRTRHEQWIREGKLSFLVETSLEEKPSLPGVPLISEFATNDQHLKILKVHLASAQWVRPFAAPPGLPPERLAMLRTAFERTLQDPEFRREMERQKIDMDSMLGEEMQRKVQELALIPDAVFKAALKATQP
jgi:tripartite-type tricarboxylate transporter receptor subunit TctC